MILKSKKTLRFVSMAVYLVLILGTIFLWFTFSEHSLKLAAFSAEAFTDKQEGGSSFGQLFIDTSYTLEFKLSSGTESPHAGVSFPLQTKHELIKENYFDFSAYDSLKITIRSDRMPRATVRLSVFDKMYTRLDKPYSFRPVEYEVNTDRTFKEYRLSLSDFKVQDRWFSKMGIENPDSYTFLDKGVKLEVLTANGAMLGIPDALEFYDLELLGKNHRLYRVLFTFGAVLSLFFLLFQNFVSRKCITENDAKFADEAHLMLLQKNMTLTEIALRAGFKNLSSCERVYKNRFGKKFGRSK